MLNFWESDDFSLISMTDAINTLNVAPSRIGSMNLFKGEGITTTFIGIESTGNELRLIPTAPRGTMPEWKRTPSRNMRAINIPHIPKNGTVMAEDCQGVREFGTEDQLVAPVSQVNSLLENLKQEHELTWEFHRLGALQGKVYDADATTLVYDLFDLFGVTRTTVNWDTTALGTGSIKFGIDVGRAMTDAMMGIPFQGIHAFCGEQFWDMLMTHEDTRDAFKYFQDNNMIAPSENHYGRQFLWQGIIFEEYRGKVGSTPFVPDAEAFAFPLTNAGIYKERWAPGTFMEAVNTLGKPYYAKQEPLKFNTGIEVHTQSNPIFLVTKPKALIKITFSE